MYFRQNWRSAGGDYYYYRHVTGTKVLVLSRGMGRAGVRLGIGGDIRARASDFTIRRLEARKSAANAFSLSE
jgi:hypothetical protein